MAEVRTLQLLLEQAERACDAARLALHQAEQRSARARHQQDDLHNYRRDYDARWLAQFQQQGASAALLQTQHQFAHRLGDALDQQGQAVATLQAREAAARQQVQACEQRAAALRKLIERREAEALRQGLRAEQKLNDEFAALRLQRAP